MSFVSTSDWYDECMRPDDAAADDALITTFGRLVEAHSHLGKHLGRSLEQEAGIPQTWFEVLLRISRSDDGQISMGALAAQVALTTGGITKLLDRMIDAGLVSRVPCPNDRRVSFAALTPQGEETLDKASVLHTRDLRRAFGGFDAADLLTLDRLLDRLRTVAIAPGGGPGGR
jgi:MarR family 2-MHQ and catechol resistance regulon transcriptional repressor